MAIDPRIALGVQVPQFVSPIQQAGNALAFKGQMMDMERAQRQEQQAAAAAERQNALAAFLRQNNPTTPEGQNALIQQYPMEAPGILSPYQELENKRATGKKTAVDTKNAELDGETKAFNFKRERVNYHRQALANVNDANTAVQWLRGGLADGFLTEEQAAAEAQAIPQDPQGFAQWRQGQMNAALTVQQQMDEQAKAREFKLKEGLNKAQIGAQNANAAQSYASADNSRANAEATRAKGVTGAAPPKPLPAAALKMQQEALDAIGIVGGINADLAALESQITDGKLEFGPVANLMSAGRNAAGMSDQKSRNFATFKSNMERLRNESLRLNTGVQTDGDAQRAWNELFQNINDTDLVKQRLQEIQRINKRGSELQRLKVDSVRSNYGLDPLDTAPQANQPPALEGKLSGKLSPAEQAELEALRKRFNK